MYNKKVLSTAKKELTKAKAPKKPKDIITDPMGQWKYPGLPTRIPGNDITMEGVGYPVLGVANNGQRKIMLPGGNYTFPGADYVDEYPQMKKGGERKKRKTKSISGTNKIMQKNPLFENYKNRVYDPNVDYFQKGGPQNTSGPREYIPSQYDYDFDPTDEDKAQIMARIVQEAGKGNKAARRMMDENTKDYTFTGDEFDEQMQRFVGVPAGEKGSHFSASMENSFVPFIQEGENGELYYNGKANPNDAEAIHFNTPEEAEFFANHYKKANPPMMRDWVKKHFDEQEEKQKGGYKTELSEEEEKEFQKFYESLPENLKSDDPTYDIRGYWDSEGRPKNFNYDQPKESDGYYHAYSINQNTGEYLKSPAHPTFQHAIEEDKKMGYKPTFNIRTGRWESEEVSPEYANGGDINLELTQDEIDEYVKGGYIVEDISIPELTKAQTGGFKPIPLPLDKTKSETTQMVSLPARQAIQHIKNKPGADKAKKKEKKEIQKFKKQLWKEYEKLPLSEKVSDRIGAFFVDPAGMTARALTGEQAYLPGMGKGLLNDEHPEIRDKYLKELGYTKGEFDASDLQNMVNPFYWASSLVDNVEKGNYGEAGLEAVLMGLPHLPKGTVSASNIKSGANMLKNDVKNASEYLTTKTPLKNTYKINPFAVKENPEMFLYRARPVNQNLDMNMAAQIRAKEAAGEPLTWWQKNLLNHQTNPQMLAREKYYGQWFEKDPSRLDFYIDPGTRNFADNDAIEILRTRLPKEEAAKLNVSQFDDAKILSASPETEFILSKDMVNSAERFPENSWQQLIQEDKAFNTPHWLKGYKEVPKQLPGSPNAISRDNVVKAGLDDNFLTRPLTLFTKNEMLGTPDEKMLYRKIGNAKGLQDLIDKGGAQAPAPMRMISGATIDTPFFGPGSKPNENYRGLFAVEIDPANPKYKWSNYVAGTQNKGVAPYNPETGELVKNIPLEDLNVYKKKWFSNNYKKLKPEELKAALTFAREQALIENLYKWGVRGTAADQIFNDGNYGKAIQNYFLGKPNTSRKKRVEAEDDYEKGGIVADLTPEEIQDYIAQGYTIEELDKPKLNQAQKGKTVKDKIAFHTGDDGVQGFTEVHKDKKGNVTTKVQDTKGVMHYKVKTKDGKVFYKQDTSTAYPELTPEEKQAEQERRKEYDRLHGPGSLEWERKAYGIAQPVDDFWTLPIGMTSAGVKGAGALVKGTVAAVKGAGKSSLAQATKAGTKALFNKAPKWAPGMNLGNAIGAGFAGSALTDIVTGKVAEPWKKANKSGKGSDYADAVAENMYTALDAIPLYGAVGKTAKQLGKYAKVKGSTKKLIPSIQASAVGEANSFVPNTLIHHPDNAHILQKTPVKDFSIKLNIKNKPNKSKHGFDVSDDEIKQVINQNLEYINHPEYIKRRQATTGESVEKIKKEIKDYTESLKHTKFDFDKVASKDAYGAHQRGTKILGKNIVNPKITVNSSDKAIKTKYDFLHILDHEVKHALSPVSKNAFSAYPKYKNYPHVDLVKSGKESAYHSADYEQQVRFLRMRDHLHNKFGISKHKELSPEEWDIFKKEWNGWLKEEHAGLGNKRVPRGLKDIRGMMELKHPDVSSEQLRKIINKSWAIAPVGIAGAAVNYMPAPKKSKQMQEGGMITKLTPKEIQEYINQGYIVEDVD